MGIQPHFRQHQHVNISVYDQLMNISGDLATRTRVEAQYLYTTLRLMNGFMNVLCGDGNQIAQIYTGLANSWSMVDMASNPDRNITPAIFC